MKALFTRMRAIIWNREKGTPRQRLQSRPLRGQFTGY
jgi:hypothetical protein